MSEKSFRVATYYDSKDRLCRSNISAYTRIYNEDWSGCKMYRIAAESGKEAKRKAIAYRLYYEQLRQDRGRCD